MLGWKTIQNVPKKNCVAVYCHTSYWEGFLLALFGQEATIVTLLKPQFFNDYTTPVLNWLGYYAAPKLEEKGSGGVQAIVSLLKTIQSEKPIILLISPKGTIENKPWRSGYKYIAKELKWPIKVMLVDYVFKEIAFQDTESDDAEVLKEQLSQACPRNPANAEMNLQCIIDHFELLFIPDILVSSNLAMLFPIYKAWLLGHYFVWLFSFAVFFVSSYYHYSRECLCGEIDKFLTKSLIVISLIYYWQFMNAEIFTLMLLSYWAYYAGTPRKCKELRGPYVVFHTLFHLIISLAAYKLIN